MDIPPPTFQLGADRQGSVEKEEVVPRSFKKEESSTKSYSKKEEVESRSKYKSMFVKGASEFTKPKDQTASVAKESKEEEWPEGMLFNFLSCY